MSHYITCIIGYVIGDFAGAFIGGFIRYTYGFYFQNDASDFIGI